jgi:hypothetical protein
MKNQIEAAIEKDLLETVAIECLKGLLASGRTEVVKVGTGNQSWTYSVEEAAIKIAERFIHKLKEKENGSGN